jgi:IPT/TIG domain-containing protein
MRARILLGLLVASIGVTGCDDSDSDGGGGEPTFASGSAVKGPVSEANVTVLALRATGILGAELGSGISGATGEFDVEVPDTTGWAAVRVTGGTFVDEATGAPATIPDDEPLLGFVDVENASEAAITPLSTLAFPLVRLFAHDPEATLDDSVHNAFAAVGNLFGLADIATLLPADLTAGPVPAGAAADAGAVVAGMAQLADGAGVSTTALIRALASDASDAHLDGLSFGVPVPLGAGALSPSAGTADLALAIADFLAGPRNASGLTAADTLVDDELALSSGAFDRPIQVRALANGHGTRTLGVSASLRARDLPPSPQLTIDGQGLTISSRTADELRFVIPGGFPLGFHDLVVEDLDSGLRTRLRDALEVLDQTGTPTITRLAPATGPLTGGTFLRIEGTNFWSETEVEIDGVPVGLVSSDFPRSMVVVTRPHAAGTVDVTIRNGAAVVTAVDAFEYRSEDVRANPDLPSPTATIVFGAFRLLEDAAEGTSAQILSGRSTFTSVDAGSFSLDDLRVTQASPAIVALDRSGTTSQSTESLGKAFRLEDSANGLTDFVRGFTSEANGVSLGSTDSGPACFFPEPDDLRPDELARAYWVNGVETNLVHGTVRQKTGWLELDEELLGSANLLVHGRQLAGTTEVGAEAWGLQWTLEQNGTFHGLRTIDGPEESSEESLTGRFSEAGDLGFLTLRGSDETLGYYLLTPIQLGIESAAFGGWSGGYVEHELADDGLGGQESASESGVERLLVGGEDPFLEPTELDRRQLEFRRATRRTESLPAGVLSESVAASALDVSPSGRVLHGDDLVGYVNPRGEIRLTLGEFPDERAFAGGLQRAIGLGAAVFRDSRKTLLSIEPQRELIALEAKLQEVGATPAQEIGTEVFGVALDGGPPSSNGITVGLAGTIPALESAVLPGTHKRTARDGTGAVTTTRGQPPAWGAEVGYAFVDDELELFATQVTQPGGRFASASMPRWLASGVLGNDGEVASLRGNDEILGDTLMFLVADRNAQVAAPTLDMAALELSYEPGTPSSVTSSRTALTFGTGTVAATTTSQTKSESGAFTTAAVSDSGPFSAPVGQTRRMVVPNGTSPDQEWQTFWTPSGDAFFGLDDTPAVDGAGLVLGVLPAFFGGSFADDDRALIGIELDPQSSRATTEQLLLAPRAGSFLTGELLTSRRAAAHALLGEQSFSRVQVTDLGAGEARVPFVGELPVLHFLFHSRDEAIGHEEFSIQITPRLIHSLDL